jgi:hemimethylated DNA binding protein
MRHHFVVFRAISCSGCRCRMAFNSFRKQLCRELLKQQAFYDSEFRPMANSLSKPAFDACHVLSSGPLRRMLLSTGSLPTLDAALRIAPANDQAAVDALKAFQHIRHRLSQTNYNSLVDVPYTLSVGDVVRHSQFGHLGVVAARLPICFESDEWVVENLGSLDDRRLEHPWYLVLVSQHMGLPPHFVRFGSQLTHSRVDGAGGIGYHNMLPTFFKGFDSSQGRYIPRFDADAKQDLSGTAVVGCNVIAVTETSLGPSCKLPKKMQVAVAK